MTPLETSLTARVAELEAELANRPIVWAIEHIKEKRLVKRFGRRATLFHGAAFFALKANVPLFVGMCRSGSDGRYTVDVHHIDTSDLTFCKADIAILASRYTLVIEESIRRWPEEWFWLHNRWKNGGDGQSGG